MSEPAIKPCPFCGRAPGYSTRASSQADASPTGEVFFLFCHCGSYSARAHQWDHTRAGVIAKWNTRVDLVTVDGLNVHALRELCLLVGVWRNVRCMAPGPSMVPGSTAELCDGANHLADCPVECALQDVLAAHNKLESR